MEMDAVVISNDNYTVIDLTEEYAGWTGKERYGVVKHKISKSERERILNELEIYSPYIILPDEFLEVRKTYTDNERKFRLRDMYNHCELYFSDEDANLPECFKIPDFIDDFIESYELERAINSLRKKQRDRIIEVYLFGMSYSEAGRAEKCTSGAVKRSVDVAIRNLRAYYENEKLKGA